MSRFVESAPAVAAATPRSRPRLTALARTAADCRLLGSWAGWSSAASHCLAWQRRIDRGHDKCWRRRWASAAGSCGC
eukprot:scaffold51263_cov36-Phaeocystis_antarctica.AAC.1